MSSFENRYSSLDRLLHKLAFSTSTAQLALADLEDSIYKSQLSVVEIKKPVFVTALPRAGTTILLELCFELNEFVSHCYRDMPFVLNPMLWSKFSKKFRKSDTPRERAHGDGLLVNVDSPEAFEEIIWKSFWRKHYTKDRILPWKTEGDEEFSDFLQSHIKKMIALQNDDSDTNKRYISKNNLNIARVDLIRKILPDAIIIIPFREPLQHAASLLRQHLNFLEIHKNDKFAAEYMAAIGHFDFGQNLRPVNFDNWLEYAHSKDTRTLSFWLEYWIAAYQYLLSKVGKGVHVLSYETFCTDPDVGFNKFADVAEIQQRDTFLQLTHRIKAAKPHPVDIDDIDPELISNANELNDKLTSASFV